MISRVRATAVALGVLVIVSCSSNHVSEYVAPSNQSIESGSEMSVSGDGQVIWVYNHASVAIMITGVQLVECENIRNSCDVQRLRIQVPAGTRTNILTVKPANSDRAYSYRFHYSWEPVRTQ